MIHVIIRVYTKDVGTTCFFLVSNLGPYKIQETQRTDVVSLVTVDEKRHLTGRAPRTRCTSTPTTTSSTSTTGTSTRTTTTLAGFSSSGSAYRQENPDNMSGFSITKEIRLLSSHQTFFQFLESCSGGGYTFFDPKCSSL